MSVVWVDGTLVDKLDAKVGVFDHGFLAGDGVWEAMRARGGAVVRSAEHVANLFASAATMGLRIPLSADELAAAVADTLRANSRTDGYVRVLVTRGAGTLGLDPRKCVPTVIVIAEEIGLYPRELYGHGLDVVTLDGPRPDPPATVLGRPAAVRAKAAALRAGCFEALRFDPAGVLIGAVEAAAFVISGGTLLPCAADPGGPDPVVRALVLDLAAAAGVPVADRPATRADVLAADEVFLAGVAGGVINVATVDGRPVGGGGEGPVSRQLREAFAAPVR